MCAPQSSVQGVGELQQYPPKKCGAEADCLTGSAGAAQPCDVHDKLVSGY